MTPDEAVAVLAAELDVVLPEELASLLYSGNDGIALDALTRNATGAPEWAEWAGRMGAYLGRRADGWATRTLWAVHEAYGRAGDLLSPDYIPGALERYGLLHVLESATTADGKPDPLAGLVLADDARMGLYAGELTALAKRVARELFAGARPDEAGSRETVTVNGRPMLRWDAGFADILEGLNGPRARELANDLRDLSAERSAEVPPLGGELWRLWARVEIGSGWGRRPRWMAALVDALWRDRWRPALERERRPVGLYRGGLVTILRCLDARKVDDEGRIIGALGVTTGRVGALTVNADALRVMGRGPALRKALDVTLAVRFVPWFASLVQRRETESEWVHLEGADGLSVWGAMVTSMGLVVNEVRVAAMKRAVTALAGQIVTLDGGIEVSLFDGYRWIPGGGKTRGGEGIRGRLALRPGPPWWTRTTKDQNGDPVWSKDYAYLAPIPVLDGWLPPLYGRDNEHAALARFWFLFLSELAEQAPRIVTHGAALFPTGRAASLALEAEVRTPPPLLIEKQLAMWKEAEIIEEVEKNGYNLHPRFAAERAVLVEGGNRRIGAKADGQHGAAVRAALRKGEIPPRRKSKREPPPT